MSHATVAHALNVGVYHDRQLFWCRRDDRVARSSKHSSDLL